MTLSLMASVVVLAASTTRSFALSPTSFVILFTWKVLLIDQFNCQKMINLKDNFTQCSGSKTIRYTWSKVLTFSAVEAAVAFTYSLVFLTALAPSLTAFAASFTFSHASMVSLSFLDCDLHQILVTKRFVIKLPYKKMDKNPLLIRALMNF